MAGYHDVPIYAEAQRLPGLVIYRFDAPLFFANATAFRDEIRRLAKADPPPAWIIVAAEPMTDVDTTASDVLEELDATLNAQGTSLVFAELKDPVRRKIERYGLTRTISPHHFFPTVESAVAAFRRETGAESAAAVPPPRNHQPLGDALLPGVASLKGDVPALPSAAADEPLPLRRGGAGKPVSSLWEDAVSPVTLQHKHGEERLGH